MLPFISHFNNKNLFEASLSRVLSHWSNREFVILSADRQSRSEPENEEARTKLKSSIRSIGLGYVPIFGIGQEENGDGTITPTSEQAFMVPNDHKDGFLKLMVSIAKGFDQWGLLWARGDGSGALITSDGAVYTEFSSIHIGSSTFFSQLKKGGENSFYLESIRKAAPADSVLEQQGRYLKGELFSHY